MVTCQTVLLHVKDPQAAIKEMLRVLKPGGLIAVAEPNNMASELILDTFSAGYSVDDIVKGVKFQLQCERGAEILGIGSGSVGDHIPAYFYELGLKDIKVYLSDKATTMHPPYSTEEHQAFVNQMKEWFETELFIWNKEETRINYQAGGGRPEDFESNWEFLKTRFKSQIDQIENHTYVAAGGIVFYLISARKYLDACGRASPSIPRWKRIKILLDKH